MIAIFFLILPIYLLLGLGYLAVRGRVIAQDDLRRMMDIVLRLFLPGMMFYAIAANPIADTLDRGFLLAYAAAGLTALGLFTAIARWAGKPLASAGVEGMGASCPNSAFFGLPIATMVLGPEIALQGFALALLVENLIVLPLAIGVCEAGAAGQSGRRAALRRMALNPLLLSALAGLVWALSGIALPAPVESALLLLTQAAAPMVLVGIGGTLVGLRLTGESAGAMRVVFGKLIFHPAAAIIFVTVLGAGTSAAMRDAVVIYAASPMMGIFVILAARFGRDKMAGAAQIAAITLSVLTIPLMLWLISGN
ncbi:MAG: AEC family transporter [Paracoccus sp. (in: a-proteobacteria)]|nr:AEC family transporter [Paracoccus sp. (in: a-proteobacteria)]